MNVFRINLKTHACGKENKYEDLESWEQREWRCKLIDFCLRPKEQHPKEQYVAIGWSCAYDCKKAPEGMDKSGKMFDYDKYMEATDEWKKDDPEKKHRANPSWKIFKETSKDDLFWTRDLDGNYWICRAKEKAKAKYDKELDIGAVVPVEAYMVGLEVPGQICGSFNRPYGGTAQWLHKDEEGYEDLLIKEYSKYIFNQYSGSAYYKILPVQENLLKSLPAEDLEELVIDYLQITKNYYVLSNSIANHSTTIKIECEFRSRDRNQSREKAVVQVKSLQFTGTLDAKDYEPYAKDGYKVYFFGPEDHVVNVNQVRNCERITEEELKDFYDNYKDVLPDSITKWEKIIEEVKQASQQ